MILRVVADSEARKRWQDGVTEPGGDVCKSEKEDILNIWCDAETDPRSTRGHKLGYLLSPNYYPVSQLSADETIHVLLGYE